VRSGLPGEGVRQEHQEPPEFEKAIGALGTGEILVLAEWDRCTRSMIDGVAIIERINARGALVKVLDKPHLDLTTPLGRGFLAFLSAMAEDERQRIVKRANAGRKAARERGARFGRKPTLSAEQQADAKRRLAGGESARSLGRIYRVSHTTIARLGQADDMPVDVVAIQYEQGVMSKK
jgi:DNA invertase Pin-like site-specific DNA recombinase